MTVVANWFGRSKKGLIFGIWNAHTSVGNILGRDFMFPIRALPVIIIYLSHFQCSNCQLKSLRMNTYVTRGTLGNDRGNTPQGSLIAGFFVEGDWALSFIVPGAIIGVVGVVFFFLVTHSNNKQSNLCTFPLKIDDETSTARGQAGGRGTGAGRACPQRRPGGERNECQLGTRATPLRFRGRRRRCTR